MNGKKRGPRWGRPLLLPMRVCTVGYAVGTPRVSKPAHGVLLVPPRSLPTHATAPKRAPGEKVEKRPSSLHLILIIRCSVPLRGAPRRPKNSSSPPSAMPSCATRDTRNSRRCNIFQPKSGRSRGLPDF